MNIKLNTNLLPIFSGTYETFWEVNEYSDDGEELPVKYKHKDLLASIAEEYQNHAEYILSELGIDFIDSIKFTGNFHSPAYYNFSTDTLDFEVEVNKAGLLKKLEQLGADPRFNQYLRDNFTSYDGFWSYTPNNYIDLKAEILSEGSDYEQAIGALLTYLGLDTGEQGYSEIEVSIQEHWQGNGYGGLKYTIEEPETIEDEGV